MSDASMEAAQEMWDAAVPDEPYQDAPGSDYEPPDEDAPIPVDPDEDIAPEAVHGPRRPVVRIVDIDTRLAEMAAEIAALDRAERGIKP